MCARKLFFIATLFVLAGASCTPAAQQAVNTGLSVGQAACMLLTPVSPAAEAICVTADELAQAIAQIVEEDIANQQVKTASPLPMNDRIIQKVLANRAAKAAKAAVKK